MKYKSSIGLVAIGAAMIVSSGITLFRDNIRNVEGDGIEPRNGLIALVTDTEVGAGCQYVPYGDRIDDQPWDCQYETQVVEDLSSGRLRKPKTVGEEMATTFGRGSEFLFGTGLLALGLGTYARREDKEKNKNR